MYHLPVAQVLVEAETEDGARYSIILQNAETVGLVLSLSSSNLHDLSLCGAGGRICQLLFLSWGCQARRTQGLVFGISHTAQSG